jgi:lycopene cyclase domain-containing protein
VATYLILNVSVIIISSALLFKWLRFPVRLILITLIILLILTAVFDNLIVGLDIVRYDPNKILGIYIFKAPLEDFMYSLLAIIIVPAVWNVFRGKHA